MVQDAPRIHEFMGTNRSEEGLVKYRAFPDAPALLLNRVRLTKLLSAAECVWIRIERGDRCTELGSRETKEPTTGTNVQKRLARQCSSPKQIFEGCARGPDSVLIDMTGE